MKLLGSLFTFVLLVSAINVGAQERRRDEPISDELSEIVSKRSELISNDLANLEKASWEGVYADGDHHPTIFKWTSQSGFVVTSSLHTFSPSWVNFGAVKFEKERLAVLPELRPSDKSAYVMPTEFIPVLWDQWHFLIPPDRLTEFAYAVHSRSEANIWSFFIRSSDTQRPRKGLPLLPAMYRKIMTMPPIRAQIVSIEKGDGHPLNEKYTLNVGKNKKIAKGMQFYRLRGGFHFSVYIEEVYETTSIARIGMIGGTDREIRKGWVLTSRMPKGFIEPG